MSEQINKEKLPDHEIPNNVIVILDEAIDSNPFFVSVVKKLMHQMNKFSKEQIVDIGEAVVENTDLSSYSSQLIVTSIRRFILPTLNIKMGELLLKNGYPDNIIGAIKAEFSVERGYDNIAKREVYSRIWDYCISKIESGSNQQEELSNARGGIRKLLGFK